MATASFGFDSFYSTTITSSINTTDTTIPVSVAPTATEGVLVLEPDSASNREIIYYTSVSGTNLVLPSVGAGRGQEGTSAVAHSNGVTIKGNTTSRHFEVLQDGSALTFTGGMANNTPIKMKNASGTAKDIAKLGTDNFLRLSQLPAKVITTTSTLENVLIETGFNFIDNDGTEAVTKAITFQNTYASAPFVFITFSGETDGADPTDVTGSSVGISDTISIVVGTSSITTTGFNAVARRSTADTDKRQCFMYLVIGTKA